MSEASAKMHLRHDVRDDDIDFAIGVLLDSFIQSQKYTVGKQIKAKFSKYLNKTEDQNSVLLHALERLIKEQFHYMELIKTKKEIKEIKITNVQMENAAKDMFIYNLTYAYATISFY